VLTYNRETVEWILIGRGSGSVSDTLTPKEQSVVRCRNQLETQTFSMPTQS
jgi:hypothetical protein